MNGTPRRSPTRSSTSVPPTPGSPDVQRYRGAVIGAGGTARQSHLPALRTVAGVRARIDIVALVDSAADVPPVEGLPLLTDPEQLARVGPLDFIDICTPTASHLDLTLWGLERGYHVVCEKPVALTRVEADRIAAAARARRGERLDRAAAAPRLRGRGHGVAALRVLRAPGDDVLHLGRAPAREPHPVHGRARRDRVDRWRAAARAPRHAGAT